MKTRELEAGRKKAREDAKKMSKEEIMRQIDVRSRVLATYCEMFEREPIPYEYGYILGLKDALKEQIRSKKIQRMLKILRRRWGR